MFYSDSLIHREKACDALTGSDIHGRNDLIRFSSMSSLPFWHGFDDSGTEKTFIENSDTLSSYNVPRLQFGVVSSLTFGPRSIDLQPRDTHYIQNNLPERVYTPEFNNIDAR